MGDIDRDGGRPGPLTGTVVHGCRLGGLLGSGGFADVYAGEPASGEALAVKDLRVVRARPDRVEREVAALARARHPNVLRYLWHEVGTGPLEGHVLLATERCVESLEDQFASLPIGPARTANAEVVLPRLVTDVLAGLDHLHGLSPTIVHRDIKPGNALLSTAGVWRVADFGIVRLLEPGADEGGDPTFAFSPGFAAPDPIRSGTITPAADLFSLGATVQWAFTGETAWPALAADQLVLHIGRGNRPTISDQLPAGWRPFVEAALDVHPERRTRVDFRSLISWDPEHLPEASRRPRRDARPAPRVPTVDAEATVDVTATTVDAKAPTEPFDPDTVIARRRSPLPPPSAPNLRPPVVPEPQPEPGLKPVITTAVGVFAVVLIVIVLVLISL